MTYIPLLMFLTSILLSPECKNFLMIIFPVKSYMTTSLSRAFRVSIVMKSDAGLGYIVKLSSSISVMASVYSKLAVRFVFCRNDLQRYQRMLLSIINPEIIHYEKDSCC